MQQRVRNIGFIGLVICLSINLPALSQLCPRDSNYYSLSYRGSDPTSIIEAVSASANEFVTLGQFSVSSSFVSRYSELGGLIWSYEYIPDYPHTIWQQYPWYSDTHFSGITSAADSTYYVFGSSYEHGKSINNVEDPPGHLVGIYLHLDKYGSVIQGKYFGNWRTDYSVAGVQGLRNGDIAVFLRSHFNQYISKMLLIDAKGEVKWIVPLQPTPLYHEIDNRLPVIQELKNGNIAVGQIMQRNVDDSLIYPFSPLIILKAPLHYFNIFELNRENGDLLWHHSYQCPPLLNTQAPGNFVPSLKYIGERSDGNLLLFGDMYVPVDSLVFYNHQRFARKAITLVLSPDGFQQDLVSYHPPNSGCALQSVKESSTPGHYLLLATDTTDGKLILFDLDEQGGITWTKAYQNTVDPKDSRAMVLRKPKQQGYYLVTSADQRFNFDVQVTDAAGHIACTETTAAMTKESNPWPWYVDKIVYVPQVINVDFRYSPFAIYQRKYPLNQQVLCEYQYACCKDVIDSLHPTEVNLCENESYVLPDQTIIREAGTYYAKLKTTRGCDSIVFFNIHQLKSPSHMQASGDTCLNEAASVTLRATEGYDRYVWNDMESDSAYFNVYTTGTYTVSVTNQCGSKTDTVEVFDHCDFPIYFPSAFTPNGDYLNDQLRVPALNKNLFVRLSIFNRWGDCVFNSTNISQGWDGNLRGTPQPAGVYVYYLEMKGLSGKRLTKRGTVALIR